MFKKINLIIIYFTFSMFLISCNNKSVSIKILNNYDVILYETETHKILYETDDEKGITFKSQNNEVATVTEEGIINAIAKGETSIIMTAKSDQKKKKTINVRVTDESLIDGTKTFAANDLIDLESKSTNLSLIDNKITSKDKQKQSIYESKAIKIEKFKELVLSYNMNEFSKGSVLFQVSVGDLENFSDYFTMATIINNTNRSTKYQTNDFGYVSIDTLINNDVENNFIKLRITINPEDEDILIKNLSITTKKENSELIFNKDNLVNKILNVPPINQLSVENIGNLICSPTSVSMVLNYYNKDVVSTDTAKKVYDSGASIYGNWTFNASYAGSFDNLKSRVEYIHNFDDVVNYIKNDIPVVFSVTTKSQDDLTGSIMAFPAGHLIVLIGFEEIDGTWYGVFNDPAEHTDEKVMRKYDLDQVFNVWRKYTYVIEEVN